MYFVEKGGNLLDLVNYDLLVVAYPVPRDLEPEEFGPRGVAPEFVALEEVNPATLRLTVPEQCALARLAGSPEEERLCSRFRK